MLVLPLNKPRNEATSAEKGLDEADDDSRRTMMMQSRVKLPISIAVLHHYLATYVHCHSEEESLLEESLIFG